MTTPAAPPSGHPAIVPRHDPYVALRLPACRNYILGIFAYYTGSQMLDVAVQWQVYSLTRSATALGLVGLVAALPIIALAIPAGHMADRLDRKRIVLWGLSVVVLCSIALAILSNERLGLRHSAALDAGNAVLERIAHFFGERDVHFTEPVVPLLYLLLLVMATAAAFAGPARAAILPEIVPLEIFSNAVTWNSSAFQISSVVGPAVGGIIIGLAETRHLWFVYSQVYIIFAVCATLFLVCLVSIPYSHIPKPGEGISRKSLGAGIHFVFEKKIILATITLDLFAVLLGGAVALLPMYADRILHVGPLGLGFMRAAPAVGAFVMAMVLAHLPPMKRAGVTLLWAVAGFGAATIIFGFSPWFWLSLLMLALTGAFDNISVVVRHTLVQVLTPNDMRGRVSAVNNVFIGSSNELGALESGLTAAAFGPIASVVGGGIGTILVVIAVAFIWPEVRKFGSLVDARPE